MDLADRLRRLDKRVIEKEPTARDWRLARIVVVAFGSLLAVTGLAFTVISAMAGSGRAAIGSLVLLVCGGFLAIGGLFRLRQDARSQG